jgi:NADH-quinone oxidoreductase subunit L
VGAAALAGIPLFSGFFSKDAIVVAALNDNLAIYGVAMVTALLTAFYSFRSVFVPFYGEPRDEHLYEHLHESPPVMTIPLWILAALSILGGIIDLPFVLTLDKYIEPLTGHAEHPGLPIELLGIGLSIVVAIFGFLMARAKYLTHESWVDGLTAPFKALQPHAENKWYVDEIYNALIVNPLKALAEWFAATFDRKVIDGAINGVGVLCSDVGEALRKLQNGQVPVYALSLFAGAVAILIYFTFR